MKKYKKILKIVLNVFIWIFVVFSVFMTILALAAQSNSDGVPSIGGKYFLTVASDSMSPTFKEGDLIFGQKLTADEKMSLEKGDVITFFADLDGNGSTELNSHRIVDINYDENGSVFSYKTQGDNKETNAVADTEPVQWQFVLCEWNGSKIPAVGGFLSFLQTPKGFLITIVLPLIVFFLYELFVFIKTLLEIKAKKKESEPAEVVTVGITAEEEEAIKQKAIEEYIKQQQMQAGADAPAPEAQAVEDTQNASEEAVAVSAEESAPKADANTEEI